MIGEVANRTFTKYVRKSEHFLFKPPSIAVDAETWDRVRDDVDEIRVYELEENKLYLVSAALFHSRCFVVARGHGKQLGLPIDYWSIESYE